MEEIGEYIAKVRSAPNDELRALADANQALIGVLLIQIKGLSVLQGIVLDEVGKRAACAQTRALNN